MRTFTELLFFLLLCVSFVHSGPLPIPQQLLRAFPGGVAPEVKEPRTETHFAPELIEVKLSAHPGEPLRFVTLTDIHENPRRLKEAIDEVLALSPHFVLFLGDLTDVFEKEHVDRMCKELSRLQCPLLPTMGNHERMGGRYGQFIKGFGPPNYTCKIGNNLFIAVDGSRGFFRREIWEWLEDKLSSSSNYDRTFLLCHVPTRDPRPEEHHCLAPSSAQKLEKLCEEQGVDVVFSGHIHQSMDVTRNGVRYLSAGLIGGRVYNLPHGGGKYHFLHVTLHDDDILVEKFFLANQPGSFTVWCGDLKMRAIYKKRLAAADSESREYDRLAKRLVLLKSKFRRYRRILKLSYQKAKDKRVWQERARKDISKAPKHLQKELTTELIKIIAAR